MSSIARHSTFLASDRMPLRAAPAAVLAAVTDLLGSEIAEVRDVRGGMSGSPAAIVTARDGAAVFVKACGRGINEQTFALYEAELPTAGWIDGLVNTPRLVGTRRLTVPRPDGSGEDWVVLAYEASTGACPATPWRDDDLRRVLDAWQQSAAQLRERHRRDPDHPLASLGLADLGREWLRIADDPDDPWQDLAPYWVARSEQLEQELAAAVPVPSHGDLRSDNILLEPDRVLFADWTHVYALPAWADAAILMIEVVASREATAVPGWVFDHPALAGVPDGAVEAIVGGFAAFTHRRRHEVRPDMPWNPLWKRAMAEAMEPFVRAAV